MHIHADTHTYTCGPHCTWNAKSACHGLHVSVVMSIVRMKCKFAPCENLRHSPSAALGSDLSSGIDFQTVDESNRKALDDLIAFIWLSDTEGKDLMVLSFFYGSLLILLFSEIIST